MSSQFAEWSLSGGVFRPPTLSRSCEQRNCPTVATHSVTQALHHSFSGAISNTQFYRGAVRHASKNVLDRKLDIYQHQEILLRTLTPVPQRKAEYARYPIFAAVLRSGKPTAVTARDRTKVYYCSSAYPKTVPAPATVPCCFLSPLDITTNLRNTTTHDRSSSAGASAHRTCSTQVRYAARPSILPGSSISHSRQLPSPPLRTASKTSTCIYCHHMNCSSLRRGQCDRYGMVTRIYIICYHACSYQLLLQAAAGFNYYTRCGRDLTELR